MFFAGLLLLAVGLYMNLNNNLSTGQSYSTRLGTSMNAESIDRKGLYFLEHSLELYRSLVIEFIFPKRKRETKDWKKKMLLIKMAAIKKTDSTF